MLTLFDEIVCARIAPRTRPRDSKVNQVYDGKLIREYHHIARFDISMNDSMVMNMLQRRELQSHWSTIRDAVGRLQHAPFDLLHEEQTGGVAFLHA